MKAWQLVLGVILFTAVFPLTSWSVENPVIRNPAGYGTIPPSNYRSGLVRSPNPIDPTGNLLMTGNVRRGMHFRGSVPYRSTTSFGATLGSSALNSFLRDTAGPEDFGGQANKYRVQPFYSPSQSVATMMPGRSEVFHPMGMRIDNRVRNGASAIGNGMLSLDSLPRGQSSVSKDTTADNSDFQNLQKSSYRGLVEPSSTSEDILSSRQIEQLVPGQLGIRRYYKAIPERESAGNRQTQEDLSGDPDEQVSLEDLKVKLEMLKPVGSADSERSVIVPSVHDAPDQTTPLTAPVRSKDFLSERSMSGGFQTESESAKGGHSTEYGDIAKYDTESLMQHLKVPQKTDAKYNSVLESDVYSGATSDRDRHEVIEEIRQQLDALTKSVEAGLLDTRGESPIEHRETSIEKRASSIANHDSLESFSQSRFNQHVSVAESHLKAGRYYRAVDSFSLASVYQPDNPIVLAGKGHSLFAAGEYMSSALFIARALTVQPDYTQVKVDLIAMLGGADKLTKRTTDVEQWLARSGSAQLQFLLSYVYFRIGRHNQAKQAINAAYEKMPDSPAVVAMRTAINQAGK